MPNVGESGFIMKPLPCGEGREREMEREVGEEERYREREREEGQTREIREGMR